MADNVTTQSSTLATIPASTKISTDEDATNGHVQRVKLAYSADGVSTHVQADADGMLVNLGANNDVTVTGTVTANLSATDNAVLDVIEVNTSYGDNTGGGTEAGALRVTIANDSTGVVSIDDNNGSLTVDGTVATTNAGTFAVQEDGAALTALQLIDDIVATDDTSTHATGTTKGAVIMAAATPTDSTVEANDLGALAMSTDRRLLVDAQIVGQDADVTIADGGNSITVDNAALSVTGGGTEATALRVTLANDSTGVISIDDNSGSITVDNAGTFATQATLQANSGVDIGDVDVTSVIPGTGATNLGKAIDSVAGATDTGVPSLAVRDDSLTTLTPADGDYVPLRVNSTGALHVTGAGGGTQYNVDDAGPTVVTMAGVVRDDTLTTLTEVDGDATVLRVSSTGALHVTGGGGGTEYTDDTSTHATGSSVGNLMMAAATPTDGSVDANDIGAVAMSTDRRLHVDAQIVGQDADVTIADGGNSITVDNGGTFAVQSTLQANSGVDIGDVDVTSVIPGVAATNLGKAEDAAHTTGDTGVMALAVRNDNLAALAGTDGDYAPLQVDADGALYTRASLPVGALDIFNRLTVANPLNQIDIQFFRDTPANLLGTVSANGTSGTAASNAGGALFSSSTDTNGEILGSTTETSVYRSGAEVYCLFTAAWLDGGAGTSFQRVGLYDANNGLFIGFENTTFGVTYRNNTSDTSVALASFSDDPLDGSAGSNFTRAGAPEALDTTKLNVFRIRFGWLGSAPIFWEIMAPDGHWVTFHKTLFPNLQATPSIRDADLPMQLHIQKTAGAGNLRIQTDCWGAGVTIAAAKLNDTVTNASIAPLTRTVLAAYNGSAYANIASTAGGNLKVSLQEASDGLDIGAGNAGTETLRVSIATDDVNLSGILADTAAMDTNLATIAGAVSAGQVQVDIVADGAGLLTTAAHDAAFGVAGTADAQVRTVQGIAGMTALVVDGSAVTQPVSGTVTANLGATDNAVLDQIELNTSYGDSVGGGTEAAALRVTIANDSTGVVSIDDNSGSITVDNGGTFAVQAASAGDVAHDSADSGNPVKVGYKAYNMDGTAPGTAVAEADRANGISDVYGRQFVETAHPNLWQAMGLYSTAQTDTSVKAAPGAGLSLYITDIVVSTEGAMNCFFEQSTTKVYGTLYLAANGGASSHFQTPIKLPANTALTFTSSAAVNHSITVNGFIAP